MEGIRKIDSLSEIPKATYEGYYWLSDAKTPQQLIDGNFESKVDSNQFIIEAMLWDKTNQTSIMITHTGKYNITEYKIEDIPGAEWEPKNYLAHRLNGIQKVSFKQLWLTEEDEFCCGMEVLKMRAQIFVGFDKPNKNNNK